MTNTIIETEKIINRIKISNKSIYEVEIPENIITAEALEEYLNLKLRGLLLNQPIRTRSKVIKTEICKILGYEVPKSFKKTQPRFPCQNFDTYVQKSNNLQIWNEELDPERRYILIKTNENDIVTNVKVVTGADLGPLDTTGTLTQKYQASYNGQLDKFIIYNENDSESLNIILEEREDYNLKGVKPENVPNKNTLLSIKELSKKLEKLIGFEFVDPGKTNERQRGDILHKEVCKVLGYSSFSDDGKFPDIKNQLLEIKLQTSKTVDLGLVLPNSNFKLDLAEIENQKIIARDIRYAIFYAEIVNVNVKITNIVIVNGENFFEFFRQFQGKELNKKIQICLPKNFL
ncbi:hypothetical protein OBK20_10630 [Empedobacter falsenii]